MSVPYRVLAAWEWDTLWAATQRRPKNWGISWTLLAPHLVFEALLRPQS